VRALFALFFVSGFPALLYQIVWQRALFSIYGVNIESVTMVVSAFMLGLGLGSLFGGWLSARPGLSRLRAFGVMELVIGLFGIFSLQAFEAVGAWTAGGSPLQTGIVTFLLVLLPTALMGATLPLLTAHLVSKSQNVGRSVGALYFVNTLGSAVACFAAGLFLLGALGLSRTTALAASLNILLGAAVLLLARGQRASVGAMDAGASPDHPAEFEAPLSFRIALILSALAGFIALSYEILWFRAFSFTAAGGARSFALLLGAYLLGLALGSLYSRRFCSRGGTRSQMLATVGRFITVANVAGFLVVPALAWLVTIFFHYEVGLPLVVLAAGALGAVFPLLCHLAIPPSARAGQQLSWLYLANILGSSLGSFLTGFLLLDVASLPTITIGLGIGGVAIGGAVRIAAGDKQRGLMEAGMVAAVIGVLGLIVFDDLYERLHYKVYYGTQSGYARVIETKSGVVSVTTERLVYGGGIYDGEFKTTFENLADDSNMLWRLYALSAFHRAPKKMLVIGLGSGSWTRVLASHPQAEKLTVIEINPGYLDIIRGDPIVGSVLTDAKVDMVIDDGRRWLAANPERRFDAVVMNTTFNWRGHSSGLLSKDFLELVRPHLEPGGVVFYNTTWHPRVQRTGAATYKHALRVGNFLAVSDNPLTVDVERWRRVLATYRIDGKSAFTPQAITELLEIGSAVDDPARLGTRYVMETGPSILARTKGYELITDDNMGTEWDWLRIDAVGGKPHP
jgi:spermidine synthase